MLSPQVVTDSDLNQSTILRRYLDLAKFLDFLHCRCLYVRRADGFADRLEGALFPELRRSINDAHAQGHTGETADDFYVKARTSAYVSCWTIGAKDNMALWQLYGGAKTSLAVTTTVGRLVQLARSWKENVEVRRVDYVDHRRVGTYVIGRYTDVLRFKNEAYAYEKELRLIVPRMGADWRQNPMGLRLPIARPEEFLRSVVLAPEAEPWFAEAVRSLCRKYDLINVPVRHSALTTLPT